jgi:hypothetical protein
MRLDGIFNAVLAGFVCLSVGLIFFLMLRPVGNQPVTAQASREVLKKAAAEQMTVGTTLADAGRWVKAHDLDIEDPPDLRPERLDKVDGQTVAEAAGVRAENLSRLWRCLPRSVPEDGDFRLYLFFGKDDRLVGQLLKPLTTPVLPARPAN